MFESDRSDLVIIIIFVWSNSVPVFLKFFAVPRIFFLLRICFQLHLDNRLHSHLAQITTGVFCEVTPALFLTDVAYYILLK